LRRPLKILVFVDGPHASTADFLDNSEVRYGLAHLWHLHLRCGIDADYRWPVFNLIANSAVTFDLMAIFAKAQDLTK
jgi:hypothetical protein